MPVVITGNNTPTAGGVTYGDGTTYAVTAAGSSGQLLRSNGASAPSWVTASSSALVFISSATASNSASISFTGLSSTYAVYLVEIVSAVPSSGSYLYMRYSINNGSSYETSGYLYSHLGTSSLNSGVNVDSSFGSIGYISVTNNQGIITTTASDGGQSGFVYIIDPSSSNNTQVLISETHQSSSTKVCHSHGSGTRTSSTPINAVQFYMDSGNIASGTFRLYGIANS